LVFGQNQHVDTTAFTLAELIDADGDHFFVSIDHIEDEIDINGRILAERRVHVALQFDVVEGKNVQVNGVPAPIGYSELSVFAGIVEVDEKGMASPFDQIVALKVRIFVGERIVQLEDGSSLSGIYVQERVVGIQEKEVWQATVKEQVFVLRADGSISRLEVVEIKAVQGELDEAKPKHGHGHGHHGKPHLSDEQQQQQQPEQQEEQNSEEDDSVAEFPGVEETTETKHHHGHGHHGKCVKKYWKKFMNWFTNLPFYLRLLVSFVGGLAIGFIGIFLIKCLTCSFCRKRSQRAKEENYKKNIHLYSLQYTAVPLDEKDAEKKAAVQNV